MSSYNDHSDPTNPLNREVQSLQQNSDSQKTPATTEGVFAFPNKRIALIYHDEFFINVYTKVFEKYGLETFSFSEINTESIAKISKINPLVVVVIDDYLGKQANYGSQITAKIKDSEKTKMMPIVLTSDRPPSEVAEDIIKIYSLSQIQK
jgi:hypothetical protein